MGKIVTVGISDLKVVSNPDSLITYALGSCVGICLFDANSGVAGMSHVLLPSRPPSDDNLMKYADTAIPMLIREMINAHANKSNLVAKIAGGASMFATAFSNSALSQIGNRNVDAVKEALKKENIPIVAEATGGNQGRTIQFDAETGNLRVRSVPKKEFII